MEFMTGMGLFARFSIGQHCGRRMAEAVGRCDIHARQQGDKEPVVPQSTGRRTGSEI